MPTYSNETKASGNDYSDKDPKMVEYEKVKKELKELITKKRGMDKSLVCFKLTIRTRTNRQ